MPLNAAVVEPEHRSMPVCPLRPRASLVSFPDGTSRDPDPTIRFSRSHVTHSDRRFVKDGYRALFCAGHEIEPHLRGVVEDALSHPGRLFRAHLAFGIQRGYGVAPETARRLAIAIEYFHTASLLFDDMPAMDDARERRGYPCAHVAHGEAAATLGALAFIARGYELLWQVLGALPGERHARASALVAECVGLRGVLNGQAHDLHFADSDHDAASVLRVAEGKTVSLIRLTLLLPALVGNATPSTLDRLERLARLWGLGYQILDDFKDCLMTETETGKSTARDEALDRPNLPRVVGFDVALADLGYLLEEANRTVAWFSGDNERWRELFRLQSMLEEEVATVRSRLSEPA